MKNNNDFELYYDDLELKGSYTSNFFKQGWQNEMEYLEQKLERYKLFDNAITQFLEDRGTITYNEYNACCSWLHHTTIEPDDIFMKVFGRRP